ncbi:hypothetical protein PSHI_22130 [Pseudomonas sp. URMO17WK12:I11]|jgi:hypothetical protein|nr:hypothetical protein PSHI_22130 [Pseudomonas sp. URMO17WK12:I11]
MGTTQILWERGLPAMNDDSVKRQAQKKRPKRTLFL